MSRESIRALVDDATPGPWTEEYGIIWKGASSIGEMGDECNAPLVAASRTAVPLLLAVADAAALDIAECGTCQTDTRGYCYRHQAAGIALTALEAAP